MRNDRLRQLTEGAVLAAIYAVFLVITLYIPVLGTLTLWLLPLPFILMVVRRGINSGIFLWFVTLALTMIVGGIISLPGTIMFGTGGLVTGYLYSKRKPAFLILLGGSLTYIANVVVVFIASVLFFDINPLNEGQKLMEESIRQAASISKMLGQNNTEQMNMMLDMTRLIQYLAPTFFVLMGIVLALISQIIATAVLRRFRFQPPEWKPFREWTFPKSFLWYYLGVTILMMAGLEEGSMVYIATINLYYLLQVFIAVQGLAVIFYFSYAKNWPKIVPVILSVFALIFVSLVVILGIIDLGFNLRKRMKT
ncbi:YybS family protein [Pseudalkalibacillus caeni]|uniref:DUF2232 domain-containing protein n=1 Tax=Exobacillus caeni TaxID=2574798 RepID=A0A5R9EWF7_9BACL|nr:YybS family protein [Pseudalkalibacillus caeni]TLS35151.1 DUF2232 domain-containing protein [Pseudalkalibacillus caeni]